MLYAPWPFNLGGVAEKTQDELKTTIGIAVGLSLTVSILDFLIVHNKRRAQAELPQNQPGETPIIIREPLSDISRRGKHAFIHRYHRGNRSLSAQA
jgi:hypothetical protein